MAKEEYRVNCREKALNKCTLASLQQMELANLLQENIDKLPYKSNKSTAIKRKILDIRQTLLELQKTLAELSNG